MKEGKQKAAKKPSEGRNNGRQEDRLLSLNTFPKKHTCHCEECKARRRNLIKYLCHSEALAEESHKINFNEITTSHSANAPRNDMDNNKAHPLPHGGGKNCLASSLAIREGANSKGFTLAEVLITLGIIGVVAAMTMPVLINKYQEQVTVNKVKKFYSMINQALLMSIKDNGYVDEWQYSNVTEFADYLKPYLKIIKDCGTEPKSGCISEDVYKGIKGNDYYAYDLDENGIYYKIALADGSTFWLKNDNADNTCNHGGGGWTDGVCMGLWYDTNGKQGPNTYGKDLFKFHIMKSSVLPWNLNNIPSWAEQEGWVAAAHILKDGNMDYLHK